MYVAEAEGYHKAQGLEVELTLFGSALERDAAVQAGQLDLELNDLISAALLNKDSAGVRVVRLAYRGNPTLPMMLVLAAPNSPIKAPADLKGVAVAISGNTVIEYSTDRLLELAGVSPGDIQKTEVTKIPVRAEMLAKGQIQAATLPEPMASLAIQQGARRILDDGQSGVGLSVITARKDLLERSGAQVKRFLVAYEQGVQALARAPDKYRALFVDKAKIPDALKDTLPIPPYPPAEVPSREEVAAALAWARRKALVTRDIPYEEMVDGSFLPGPGTGGR
jgi:NitT/TauT family transport system substrate-binding protein